MMKKFGLMMATLVLSASSFASEQVDAEYTQFRAGSDNPVSQLCIAALESKDALREKAIELKMTRKEVRRVECNDMDINEFAHAYRDVNNERAFVNVQ